MKKTNAFKLFHTTDNIYISSPFGYRDKNGKKEFHEGVDYASNGKSIPVYAVDDGVVLNTGTDITGAIFCYVYFPKLDRVGLYYHLSSVNVKKGINVTVDAKIGMTGKTGNATGIHLHFDWFPYSDYPLSITKRNNEDYNAYVFPNEKIGVPKERDTSKNQIEVKTDILRAREEPSLSGNILGFITRGIYNIISTEKKDGYTWYQVENSIWIAYDSSWAVIYNKEDNELNTLKEKINVLNDKISLLEKKLKEINDISNI